MQVEATIEPCGDRIAVREQPERAHDARPLQRTEGDVVGEQWPLAAEKRLSRKQMTKGCHDCRNASMRASRPACTSSSALPSRSSRLLRK